MFRRLYIQIYLTIIASLILVAVISGLVWDLIGSDRANRYIYETSSKLASLAIPPASAPVARQHASITRIGRALDIDISLYDESGKLITRYGKPIRPSRRHRRHSGLYRGRDGSGISLVLTDGRRLLANRREEDDHFSPFLYLLAVIGLVGICIAIGAYPLTRRITKRLEKLQHGVESIGAGDLSARVEIKGRDEVARLASSFNDSAQKIERLVVAHRMLLANASHELRTPLSRIRLGIELEQQEQTPERREALKQDIAELDQLIDEILLMSRLDVGGNVNMNQTVDLVALAAEECAKMEDCNVTGRVPEIQGDPKLLQRMLRNLLENALKYGKPPIEVKLNSESDHVTVTVTDSGEGISESDREQVFQPFYRGAGQQNVIGYGLGLTLVKQITEVHGGFVELLPKSLEKSAVKINLPAVPATETAAEK